MKNKLKGMFFGLFIGDAIGTTLEFKVLGEQPRIDDMVGGGVFKLNPGEWTDDGSMALCLAESILDNHSINKTDIMRRFARWYLYGDCSSNGKCFDIGGTCNKYINNFISKKGEYEDAENLHWEAGNGAIMRVAPVFIPWTGKEAIKAAQEQGVITHGNDTCKEYMEKLSLVILNCLNGVYPEPDLEIKNTSEEELSTTGYVVDTYDAALWAFWNTDNFRDCILSAANLCGDADTIAAVAGQIAGAWYGFDSIPSEWYEKLASREHLEETFEQLLLLRKNNTVVDS